MYNDLLPINEDWYDDKAKESLKWDDSDTALVGIGTVDGLLEVLLVITVMLLLVQ